MSRHNVTYKPGGAVGKTLEMTLKMQRVTPAVPAVECPECPVSPPLMGVWRDPLVYGSSDLVTDSHLDVSAIYDMALKFITSAEIVNDDWVTAGVATPLLIDVSALVWDVTVESFPFVNEFGDTESAEFSYHFSGISMLVFAIGYGIDGSHCNEVVATITATPIYNGVRLNTLTMNAIRQCW